MKRTYPSMITTFVMALLAAVPMLLKAQDPCQIKTEMLQLKLTCSDSSGDNGKTAQVKVNASGGVAPYSYYWEEGSPGDWDLLPPLHVAPTDASVVIGLKAYRWYRVTVTDSDGCVTTDSIHTRAYPTPVIDILCEPGDTVYLQNPDLTLSFENLSADSINIDHFFWTFEHNLTSTQEQPVFTYVEAGSYHPSLTVYDDYGCDTVYIKTVYVNPVQLKIPSVFTPNGDSFNDTFVITLATGSDTPASKGNIARGGGSNERPLSDYYKSSELVVMNRWGRIVYHSSDYQNDWDGGGLSDGTYYYVLRCKGLKEEVQYEGVVMIITKSN